MLSEDLSCPYLLSKVVSRGADRNESNSASLVA